jgi:hypothetical protein
MRGLATRPIAPIKAPREQVRTRTAWPLVRPGGSPALRRGRCVTNTPARESDEWITKRELAAHLKMTTRWIEYQQLLGLPVLRLGAANRYKVSEVEAWLRERYHSIDAAGRS